MYVQERVRKREREREREREKEREKTLSLFFSPVIIVHSLYLNGTLRRLSIVF